MLDKDILLNFRSISMPDGHAGAEVKYIAADRKVLNTFYCTQERKKLFRKKFETTTDVEQLSIPDYIQTEEELRDYVQKYNPFWLR